MAEKIDREEWIKQFMVATGLPRERAEFAADVEFGVLPDGDVVVESDNV